MSFKEYLKKEKYTILKEFIFTIIFASIISLTVGFILNKDSDSRVADRQVIYDLSRTFFDNQKYRDISTAIEEQYLYDRGPIFQINGGRFSDYEIDDYLYFLYDLNSIASHDFVDYSVVGSQYSYYVCITYNNKEIQQYRERLLNEGFSDDLANGFLEDLANNLGISHDTSCKLL